MCYLIISSFSINTTILSPIQKNETDRLQQLPTEIITQILLYLDLVSVQRVSQTCRQFNRICGHKNHYLWQTLFHADFLIPKKRPDSTPYYELYKSHFELDKRWKNGQVTTRYLTGHDDSVYCLVWAGKDQIVSGSRDWSIKLWDLSKPKSESPLVLTKTQHEGSVLCLRVSPDMSFIVSGSSDATCLIWSLPDFTPKQRLEGHTGGVLDVCVLDNYIVSSSRDTTIRVWDMSGREVRRLVGHSGPVNALGSHEDRVVSASGDATIKLWNIVTGDCLRTFTGHTRGLACVKFDGALIYSGGQDNKLKVWDSKTGECVSTLSGHSDLIRTIDSFEVKY